MRVAGREFADMLVDEAQREMFRLERARLADLWRAAGADVAHLRPFEVGIAAVRREGIPIECLVDMAHDIGAQRLTNPELAGKAVLIGGLPSHLVG